MAPKKIPIRKCVACGAQRPKRELVRIVRTPDGDVRLDPTGRQGGRGAYVCPNAACFETALKKKLFQRALEVELTPEIVERLREAWGALKLEG
ncbi:YlxR family protein [Hydrogenibacillus sp. N12]|uniref:RNase P modulator RnpM n=1 Tax=Hydrogenibacillus sp. N12 TaxID=2866627 RepID=UPI0019D84065|nr:YlxR family protein [Hydrogenibacillus sp. N12]MBE3562584.1 YlxR family protein [Hydrogenibacillus schlegelii]QZA33705.1 YlxR family protein [Hydrogenibacillus sp. N12]